MVSNSGTTIRSLRGLVVERAAHEPGFLLQHQHFEQIAHVLGVRNDVVAQRLAAVAREHRGRGLEDRELVARVVANTSAARTRSAARIVQTAAAAARAARASERAVIGLDARDLQQFGDDRFVLVGALAQIDGREMKAEHLRPRAPADAAAARPAPAP